ncbi:MAG TPA: hypothetical protein ENK47_05585 [Euryarchaeota archaeon]|nr:MAG: hypothetical protein DRN57_01955 [Thermoplasmata archaeon]HHD16163.1 hypothetical protein [Euryarchaeota archaeon]
MRSAGRVVNFSHKGAIILRSTVPPGIGDIIVDRRSEPVGKVIRITGPVKSPYVIVNPFRGHDELPMSSLLGRELFISRQRDQGRPGQGRRGSGGLKGNHDERTFRGRERNGQGRQVRKPRSFGKKGNKRRGKPHPGN